jgi:hypothetical protein
VLDQYGAPMAVGGMVPLETVSFIVTIRRLADGQIIPPPLGSTGTNFPCCFTTDSSGQFSDQPVGMRLIDLAKLRRSYGFDISATSVGIKSYSINTNSVVYPNLATFIQTVCQNAIESSGSVLLGNCGVSEIRQ